MTENEILMEMVDYYSSDTRRRATLAGASGTLSRCVYQTECGKHCAMGRCMVSPEIYMDAAVGAATLVEENGQDIFKEEYRGYDKEFWTYIQGFHDADANWNRGGLTPYGQDRLDLLKKIYPPAE